MAGKLQFLSGLLPFSATSHYSWQSQGKHNSKTAMQLPHSGGILSGKLWDGFCAQSWAGTLPCFRSSQGTNTESSQCHIQGAELGQTRTRRSHHYTWGVAVLVSCPSWCHVHPQILPITESCPSQCPPWHCHSLSLHSQRGCCAGLPPHHLSFQSPGAALQSPALPVSVHPPALLTLHGLEAQPEALPTPPSITTP